MSIEDVTKNSQNLYDSEGGITITNVLDEAAFLGIEKSRVISDILKSKLHETLVELYKVGSIKELCSINARTPNCGLPYSYKCIINNAYTMVLISYDLTTLISKVLEASNKLACGALTFEDAKYKIGELLNIAPTDKFFKYLETLDGTRKSSPVVEAEAVKANPKDIKAQACDAKTQKPNTPHDTKPSPVVEAEAVKANPKDIKVQAYDAKTNEYKDVKIVASNAKTSKDEAVKALNALIDKGDSKIADNITLVQPANYDPVKTMPAPINKIEAAPVAQMLAPVNKTEETPILVKGTSPIVDYRSLTTIFDISIEDINIIINRINAVMANVGLLQAIYNLQQSPTPCFRIGNLVDKFNFELISVSYSADTKNIVLIIHKDRVDIKLRA